MSGIPELKKSERQKAEIRALEHAYVTLINGDPHLANYMVRDLEITKAAGEEILNSAWTVHHYHALAGEVRILVLDPIARHVCGEYGPLVHEMLGVARRLVTIDDLLSEIEQERSARGALTAERAQTEKRVSEEKIRLDTRMIQIGRKITNG